MSASRRLLSTLLLAIVHSLVLAGCSPAPDRAAGPAAPVLPGFPAGSVRWRAWSERDTANASGAPVLLFLFNERSWWCREAVRRCFQSGDLPQEIDRETFPVRVNVDLRPDLAARYGMGAWPTVAFLEPGDTLITGGVGFDPEDLTDLLRRVEVHFGYADRREDLRAAKRRLAEYVRREAGPPAGPVAPGIDLLARVVDSTRAAADRGVRLSPESLLLLMERTDGGAAAREQLNEMAEAVRAAPTGFYRVPLTADGRIRPDGPIRGPIRSDEASLAVNGGALETLSLAADLLDDRALARAARRLAVGLQGQLQLDGHGLLGAGLSFPVAADTSGPDRGPRPACVDTTVYTGWNGLAASGFVACYTATQDAAWLSAAQAILRKLGQPPYLTEHGLRRSARAGEDVPRFLEDQAFAARAALDVHAASGDTAYLAQARRLTEVMLARYRTASGALRDRDPETGTDYLPVTDRAAGGAAGVAVQVLTRMWQATGEVRYRDAASRALAALVMPNVGQASRMGALGRGLRLFLEARKSETGN